MITLSNKILNITGSITTSVVVSGGGNATAGIIATGTAGVTGTGSYSVPVVGSTGVEILVSNLNPKSFTYNDQLIHVLYKKATDTTYTRVSTQTATSLKFKAVANTDYNIRIRVAGYVWQEKTINSGASGLTLDAALVDDKDLGGSSLYTSSGIVQAQVDALSYNATSARVEVKNTGATELTINFNSAYFKMQNILHLPALISAWANQLQVNSLKNGFEFPSGNVTKVYLSSDSTQNVFLNFTLKNIADNSDARDRVFGNVSGWFIAFPTTINNLSIPYPTAQENANAVKSTLTIPTAVDIRTEVEKTLVLAKATEVTNLYRSLIATTYTLTTAVAGGATEIPIPNTFTAGYFTNHYIVVNDGAGNVIQRYVTEHVNTMLPIPKSVLKLSDPISALAVGATIIIQTIKATDLVAINAIKAKTDALTITNGIVSAVVDKTGYTLTDADKKAIAVAIEKAIIDETDGERVIKAIIDNISTGNVTATSIVEAIKKSSVGKNIELLTVLNLAK